MLTRSGYESSGGAAPHRCRGAHHLAAGAQSTDDGPVAAGGGTTGSAVVAVARHRLRRRRAASAVLLVVTGLGAAAPMALWSASRQTVTAVDRFIERAAVPDATIFICPPGLDVAAKGPERCFKYEDQRDLDAVRELPGVEAASRFSFRPVAVTFARRDTGSAPVGLGISSLGAGAGASTVAGDPIVVEGRMSAREATDEVVVTEPGARSLGLSPGDRVVFRPGPQVGDVPDVAVEAEVVGVVRTPADLLPLPLESVGGPAFHAGTGWIEAHGGDLPGFGAVSVWLDDADVDGFVDRARQRLEDQEVFAEPVIPPGEVDTLEHATSLESRAGLAIAATAALAAAFFVGQAVSRQSRAEAAEGATLLALGMTRRQLAAVPAVRWLPVAVGGAVLAVTVAIAASALGPIGVARRGIWDRSPYADWPVLAVGGTATVGLVLAVPVLVALRRSPASGRPAGAAARAASVGPPGLRTGIGFAWASLRRGAALPLVSAVAATALAIAAIITAAGGAASLQLVTEEPDRFGAPWDALASGVGGFESAVDAGPVLSGLPGVTSAAGLAGTDVAIGGDEQVWTQAFLPVPGVPPSEPVIVAGRAPDTDREIALGSVTMSDAGARLGADVELEGPGGGDPLRYRVVGEVMVTDGFEPNVGDGALVSPEGLARIDPIASEEAELGVAVVDGAGRAEALDALRRALPGTITPFPVPSSLANAERIAGLPVLLAVGGAVLAAVTFVHALVTSVRRNRRELAVCRVLGFTSRQVHTAVATQATVLALAAVVVGLPLGIIGARWGWRTLARSFGVVSGPLVPVWVVLASAAVAVLVANLAAGPPSLSTTRRRPADALRSE